MSVLTRGAHSTGQRCPSVRLTVRDVGSRDLHQAVAKGLILLTRQITHN